VPSDTLTRTLVRRLDLVGQREIASRLGVPVGRVHTWVYRDLMPSPVLIVGNAQVWAWREVEMWWAEFGPRAETWEIHPEMSAEITC
jgi:hypothetical protein